MEGTQPTIDLPLGRRISQASAEVRPRWSGDAFQGAQRSYHDFLVGDGDWRVSFEDWADDYGLELRVTGTSASLVARDTNFNTTTGQLETTETPLAGFTLTSPAGSRLHAVGVALDIGATQATSHTVTVSVWSNGSQRLVHKSGAGQSRALSWFVFSAIAKRRTSGPRQPSR